MSHNNYDDLYVEALQSRARALEADNKLAEKSIGLLKDHCHQLHEKIKEVRAICTAVSGDPWRAWVEISRIVGVLPPPKT